MTDDPASPGWTRHRFGITEHPADNKVCAVGVSEATAAKSATLAKPARDAIAAATDKLPPDWTDDPKPPPEKPLDERSK
jgi:hypothetical protein